MVTSLCDRSIVGDPLALLLVEGYIHFADGCSTTVALTTKALGSGASLKVRLPAGPEEVTVRWANLVVHELLLQSSKEALDDGVVVAVATTAHAHLDPVLRQLLAVGGTCVLAAPAREVEQVRRRLAYAERGSARALSTSSVRMCSARAQPTTILECLRVRQLWVDITVNSVSLSMVQQSYREALIAVNDGLAVGPGDQRLLRTRARIEQAVAKSSGFSVFS